MSKYLGVFSFTWISTHGDWEKHVRNDLSPVLELLGYEFKKWGQLAYYCPMTLLDEPQAVKAAVYEASFAPMHLSVCREPPVFDIPGLLTLMLYFETAAFAGFRGGALKPSPHYS